MTDHATSASADSTGAAKQDADTRTLRIAVTGASGLIGTALTGFLSTRGHTILRLTRSAKDDGDASTINWQPDKGEIDPKRLEGLDVLIHLAGESIAGLRWTAAKKARIRNSRVESTRLLSETIAKLNDPPGAFLCASAMGYYGNRGNETLTEDSPPGQTFLARVCREWEAAADDARNAGVRTLHMRFGLVLAANGGPLQQMLTPFRLGVGGKVGSGSQYWSWVAIDDLISAVSHLIEHEHLSGPVNVVSPNPVTNYEFTKVLGRVLKRPTVLPVPGFAARIALGEMANELLLASARVEPKRLLESGFEFQYRDLESALRHLLG
jgi:uncharacterized protein